MNTFPVMNQHDALLIVHVQNDFCPGGALPVPEGDKVVPVLNQWIAAARGMGARIYATRDWHPAGHASFRAQGGPWPDHCVQHSPGAAFRKDLDLPPDTPIIDCAFYQDHDNYSSFQETGLTERLRADGIERLWVGGLAEDYCVLETVLDGLREGFEVHLIRDATRPVEVHPGDGKHALDEMRAAGAVIEG
jgi:nicotinamidase/pyrazinamidase